MEDLIKWIKENVGDEITIITPQFERTEPLEFDWKPSTKKQFMAIVEKAPLEILFGLGFRKWDTMNTLIKENHGSSLVEFPVINSPNDKETITFKVGSDKVPTKLLDIDEDVLLFPGEWFDLIPEGFKTTGLYGEETVWEKAKADDDIRFGCLAYGIRRTNEHSQS